MEIRRRLGYLPQSFGAARGYTVREFLSYVAWLRELPGARIARAVEHAAESVGLRDHLEQRLRALDYGHRRRVGIAQAVVNSPALLVLDEPTAGLDPRGCADLHLLVRELGRRACVVLATREVEDIEYACSDVTMLAAGRVAFHGTVAELTAAGGYAAPAPDA